MEGESDSNFGDRGMNIVVGLRTTSFMTMVVFGVWESDPVSLDGISMKGCSRERSCSFDLWFFFQLGTVYWQDFAPRISLTSFDI